MKLLIMQFSIPYYTLPLSFTYFLQAPFLKHPEFMHVFEASIEVILRVQVEVFWIVTSCSPVV